MIHPRPLSPGDVVAVLSPAGPVLEDHIEDGLALYRGWGYSTLDFEPFLRDRHGYMAGSDRQRARQFLDAWTTPEVRALACSRGGYGAMRLLPLLETQTQALLAEPRLLIGFSDITALHLWIGGVLNLATLHGPVLKSLSHQRKDAESLKDALSGRDKDSLEFAVDPVVPGIAHGRALGGNLSIVAAMLATRWCPDLNGSVLFLEDVGEVDYRLDRLFTALRISEKAHSPAAIVLGEFTNCGGVYISEEDIRRYVEELASEFDCPVVSGFPMGHGQRNATFPIGVEVEVDADRGSVRFESDAVRP